MLCIDKISLRVEMKIFCNFSLQNGLTDRIETQESPPGPIYHQKTQGSIG